MKALKPPFFPLLFLLSLFISSQLVTSSFTISPPQASFTYTPSNPWVNGIVTFNASASEPNGGTIINYTWNFGDNTPILTEFTPVTAHVYTASGIYVITLNITDSEGLWSATSKPVIVSSGLELTVMTDKPKYEPEIDEVQIQGNLTFNGNPVSDGLVALEVRNPAALTPTVALRTLKTGTAPISGTSINITELYLCDQFGNPINSTIKVEDYITYVYVTLKNIGNETISPIVLILSFYQELYPLCWTSAGVSALSPGSNMSFKPSVSFPSWISVGNATAYVSVLNNYPRLSGYPYCPEKFLTFSVDDPLNRTNWTPISGESPQPDTNGTYNSSFKIPGNESIPGIYRVYVTSLYQGRFVTSNTVFGVNVIYVPDHFLTIQEAIDAASPTNNSILVFPGTYNEHVTIYKSLTLFGINPSNTIINGSGTGTVVTVVAGNVEISRFTIQNSGGSIPDSGILLTTSAYCTISENTISKNYNGIYLNYSSQENIIRNNTIISNNGYGINLYSSHNNRIIGNMLLNNRYGVYLNYSIGITLRGNPLIGSNYAFGIFGDSISYFEHNIDTSNIVNGKPVIYWKDQNNRQVPSDAGFVAIVRSTNITVRGIKLTKNGQGVLFAFTNNSRIEIANIISNDYGIYLDHSYSNIIVGSTMLNNYVGIHQNYCSENIICHNNFTYNTNQVDLYESSNTWNDSAGKGNFWSDYNGTDLTIPPDGVGDTNLPWQGVDYYPLMYPWIPVHDVAITNITLVIPYNFSKIYQGWDIEANVTVKNEGDSAENFDVTAYYDGNPISDTKTVILYALANTTLTFRWNTTDVPYGDYTISAYISVVLGETHTADNTFEDGVIEVKVPGDANGDGKVGYQDYGLLAASYGSKPGDSNWNPNCDFYYGDNRIGFRDYGLLAKYYGTKI